MGGSGNIGKMNVLIPTGNILFALFHFSLLKSSAPLERGILLLLLLLKLFCAVAASGVQKIYVLKQTVNVSKTLSSLSINKKIMNCREECALGCRILQTIFQQKLKSVSVLDMCICAPIPSYPCVTA